MATWTDGAAYAPIERPDGFATPEAEALEVAVPQLLRTPGPIPPPNGFQPSAPQAPLDQIRTDPPPTRDPGTPFVTASATLTAGPDHVPGAQRDPLQPFETYTTSYGSQELPPPTGQPLPPPSGAPLQLSHLPPPPGQFNSGGQFPAQLDPDTRKTLHTLLVLAIVGLGIGLLVPGTLPWLVLATGLLGLRTKPLTGSMGVAACCTGVTLLLAGLAVPDLTRLPGVLAGLVFIGWAIYGLRRKSASRR